MTSTSLQPPTRMARSLNPLITKDLVLKFSGVLPPLGKPRCLRSDRRSLYDSADDAGSSASAVKPKRHKHGAPSSPDSHRKPKKHKKHKKPHSKAFYAHSVPASSSSTSDATPLSSSPAPSSSTVTAAFTANSGARSPPAPLPAALRPSLSALRTRASQAVWKDSRITAEMARLRDIPFLHFESARRWTVTLGCQTCQVRLEPVDGKDRVPSMPCSLVGLRAFTSVFSSTYPCKRLRRMLPEVPFFFSPAVCEEAPERMTFQTRPSSLMGVLGDMWVKMRGERSSEAASSAASKTYSRRPVDSVL
ncbi:hypothetical protein JG688_00012789 [Phytophthora aleatoria]|uniref:Uncharacterized protein n=1 Tax=Phytophthora aleatoria TaxID=2496075 RepID=A0A8J5IAB2_9STRA|nr:hypothetical protein JG688_00012789 [Phytophthora aleatoria]